MSAHPKEPADDKIPFYSRPKAERDAILRAAGMRPAETDEPFPHFDAIRTRPTLRSLWYRLFGR